MKPFLAYNENISGPILKLSILWARRVQYEPARV